MADELGRIPVTRRTGKEQFHADGKSLGHTLLEFWQWARCDLLGNTDRGVLAEYIVALDLGVAGRVREGWGAFDLETRDGTKVEVKSSAYVQSWRQQRLSKISFGIGPTHAWDPETDVFDEEKRRQADVYVFCVLAHKDQATFDPLNLNQWDFYVLRTIQLDEGMGDRRQVRLERVLELGARKAQFSEIGKTIRAALR